jgi:hypothetical protein
MKIFTSPDSPVHKRAFRMHADVNSEGRYLKALTGEPADILISRWDANTAKDVRNA